MDYKTLFTNRFSEKESEKEEELGRPLKDEECFELHLELEEWFKNSYFEDLE